MDVLISCINFFFFFIVPRVGLYYNLGFVVAPCLECITSHFGGFQLLFTDCLLFFNSYTLGVHRKRDLISFDYYYSIIRFIDLKVFLSSLLILNVLIILINQMVPSCLYKITIIVYCLQWTFLLSWQQVVQL